MSNNIARLHSDKLSSLPVPMAWADFKIELIAIIFESFCRYHSVHSRYDTTAGRALTGR